MSLREALRELVTFKLDEGTTAARVDAARLESALDILEADPIACDERASGFCAGPVHTRTCADCAHAIARCEAHGGRKSVSRYMWLHRNAHHQEAA